MCEQLQVADSESGRYMNIMWGGGEKVARLWEWKIYIMCVCRWIWRGDGIWMSQETVRHTRVL